ncbi:hypothetical protein, partial [Mesorhizobium sp. M7A.F.Ca.CA.004.08.2.1]|uniref:hypothetical protein n=2 Tax=unclassified Mesorhizobium TaxID=325217 RepID=UPI0019D477E0
CREMLMLFIAVSSCVLPGLPVVLACCLAAHISQIIARLNSIFLSALSNGFGSREFKQPWKTNP